MKVDINTDKSFLYHQVVKMVVIILMVFIVCWLPLQVLILYAQFSHNQHKDGEVRSGHITLV